MSETEVKKEETTTTSTTNNSQRASSVFMAKLAEQAERYEEKN